jgi:hypothetical protein
MQLVCAFLVVGLAAAGARCGGAEPGGPTAGPAAATADRHPELKRLSPVEDVWIDAKAKTVVVGAEVTVDSGAIEYFACPQGTKDYESLVATRSTARLVHTALIAIGLVPGKPVTFDPAYAAASGPVVRVTMRWKDKTGQMREARAQEWVRDTRTRNAMRDDWVFAGSSFWRDPTDGKEYYQADGGDLICVSNFPTATLDLTIESSQSNDALLFEAFEGHVPPKGTQVEILLSAGSRTASGP